MERTTLHNDKTIADKSKYLPKGALLGGRYIINNYLNSGGFGNTYVATDKRFNATVAIKELYIDEICGRSESSSDVILSLGTNKISFETQKKKFIKEAYRLYKFSHPNVVKVSDVFEENGTAYYVMEYIDGVSLHDFIKQNGALSESQVFPFLEQILLALEYVHSNGVLHLDLKPGNIMLEKSGRIILIDFGTSKPFEDSSIDEKTHTLSQRIYTKGYAAPEQSGMASDNVGTYSDIYALGATIYYLLSGYKPKEPNEIMNYGLPKLNNASSNMWNIITRAMAYRINDRVKTIDEFRNLLRNQRPKPLPKTIIFLIVAIVSIAISAIAISILINQNKDTTAPPPQPSTDSIKIETHNNNNITTSEATQNINPIATTTSTSSSTNTSTTSATDAASTTEISTSDATTWGLKGPVKYVSNIGISILNESSASFNKQGKATSISGYSNIKRSNSRIYYMEYYNEDYECYFPADFYYSNGKLSNIKFYSDDCEYKTKVSYNSKGDVSKESETAVYLHGGNQNMGTETTTYQYISYDHYDNWTKRVVQSFNGTETRTETRTITYY